MSVLPEIVAEMPEWLAPIVRAVADVRAEELSAFLPPEHGGRRGAVLILFGYGAAGPDLLIIQRTAHLRSHPGQPAFPGGALEDVDSGPVDAALREAAEETGLDPGGVQVFATLPDLWLPPSNFVVTPVLAWWHTPSPVWAREPYEVASVHRVSIRDLADPANRVRVQHPSGYVGPGFTVAGLTVWGFTGSLVDRLLWLAGWERPWQPGSVVRVAL